MKRNTIWNQEDTSSDSEYTPCSNQETDPWKEEEELSSCDFDYSETSSLEDELSTDDTFIQRQDQYDSRRNSTDYERNSTFTPTRTSQDDLFERHFPETSFHNEKVGSALTRTIFGVCGLCTFVFNCYTVFNFLKFLYYPMKPRQEDNFYYGIAFDSLLTVLIFLSFHIFSTNHRFGKLLYKSFGEQLHVFTLGVSMALIWYTMNNWKRVDWLIWDYSNDQKTAKLCKGLYIFGLISSLEIIFSIDPLNLLGLTQLYDFLSGQLPTAKSMKTKRLYRHARVPLFIGPILLLFSTPTLPFDRLCLGIYTIFAQIASTRLSSDDVSHIYNCIQKRKTD